VRLRTALLAVVAVGVLPGSLAGCRSGSPAAGPAPGTAVPASTAPAPTTTPTTTPPRRSGTPVVTRDGACPYFGAAFAEQTIGQHLARSTVTSARPYPGCTLYRPDGGKAIEIQVSLYGTPLAAQQRAVSLLGHAANPTDVGDRATVAIVADGARLLASKGRYLIAIFINQQSSLQAHDIATAVVNKIH
jgi:hypothetical protein